MILINREQFPEERRAKYYLARYLGAKPSFARRYRDWRWTKIARRFGYSDYNKLMEGLSND